MQNINTHAKGIVLVAVLVTISLLTLLLTGAIADAVLLVRSNNAYWQSNQARLACEQLAANAGKGIQQSAVEQAVLPVTADTSNTGSSTLIYQQRLLNTKPCAMVWPEQRSQTYKASFFMTAYQLMMPDAGICEITVASLDRSSPCLTPTITLRPGLQSWRWLPDVTPLV